MPKIVFLQPLSDAQAAKVREAAPSWEVIHGKASEIEPGHLQEAEVICGWNDQVETQCLRPNTPLRWVHAWSAGVDGMPLARLHEAGIIVTHSSGVHPYPISETVFAMMLGFTRKLHTYIRNQLEKKWHHANVKAEMHGATIGIIGVGAIGTEIARLARAFHMTVLGLRRSGEPKPEIDIMYTPEGLPELLRQSDYVVNTLPLTKESLYMIGEEQFQQMKETAFYVNIGRGKTTDTAALIRALQEGWIAGAGLDVFEEEPLPPDHPLWTFDNVILSPHTSGSTLHYHDRALELFLHNWRAFAAGQDPEINRVDPATDY